MPTINQLPVLSPISSGDQLPVYSPNNGDARRTSIGSLLTFFQQSFASPTVSTNLFVPGTGFNITVPTPVSQTQWMLLQPAGTLATGTITLPLNTGVPDGTEVLITSTQSITAFTLALNGASAIFGNVTTLQAGTALRFRFYQATNSWYNIMSDEFSSLSGNIQTFLANPSSANLLAAMTDETGTGLLVFNNTPTLVTPILGTPTSGTLTNCTGLPLTGTTGTLDINRGGSGTTTATGSGNLVLATSPALTTPDIGTPTAGVLSSCTGLSLTTGVTGTLPVANGGTGATAATGTGDAVLANTPTLITPNLGVASATSLSTGPVFATIQSLSGPGAVNITSLTTAFTSSGTGDALTLADGAAGQIKTIVYVAQIAGADTGILTPANLGSGTTITFNDVGDSVQLQYIGTNWWVISAFGAVVA
jgi:hypothetical protein